MPQYVIPQEAAAKALDAKADAAFVEGAKAGSTADKYIRDTVFLATVLFLVGISGHFRIRQARLGLIGMGGLLLAFAVSSCSACPDRPRSQARADWRADLDRHRRACDRRRCEVEGHCFEACCCDCRVGDVRR